MRRAARALLWTVSCALAVGVSAGVSLLSLRFALGEWRGGHHTLVLLFTGACQLAFVGAPMLVYWYARRRWAGRRGKARAVICAVGVFVALVGWLGGVIAGRQDVDQQIMHDRGMTAAGQVTRYWNVEGDNGPIEVDATVRLDNGMTVTVSGYDPHDGSTVQVTRDPLGKADPQLAPRPGAPGRGAWKVSLAVLIAGHIMAVSSIAVPPGTALDPRSPRRRRRAPADQAPADKAPSPGLGSPT
jgi:hypothetical protein